MQALRGFESHPVRQLFAARRCSSDRLVLPVGRGIVSRLDARLISKRDTPQAQDDAAQDAEDSRTIKDHKALQNQSSMDPQDYPKGDRSAQSLVRKPGDKD